MESKLRPFPANFKIGGTVILEEKIWMIVSLTPLAGFVTSPVSGDWPFH